MVVTSRSAIKNKNREKTENILKVLDQAVTQMAILQSSNTPQSSSGNQEQKCSCPRNEYVNNQQLMISKAQCTQIVQQNLNQLSSLLQASYASLVDDSSSSLPGQ